MFTGHLAHQLQDVCYIVLCSRSSFEGDLSPLVYNREYRLRDILSLAHSLLAEHVSCTYGLERTGHKQQPHTGWRRRLLGLATLANVASLQPVCLTHL